MGMISYTSLTAAMVFVAVGMNEPVAAELAAWMAGIA